MISDDQYPPVSYLLQITKISLDFLKNIHLPLIWSQVDINSFSLSVNIEKDKGELVPVERVVNLR